MFLVRFVWLCLFSVLFVGCAPEAVDETPTAAAPLDFSNLPETAVVRPENPDGSAHQVLGRLLLDKKVLRPGDTARLGLYLLHDEGWHTYWKSNVEVGQPTDIQWGLPAGFTENGYTYPIPERFDTQDIISFGYDKEVLLFTEITVPDDAVPGQITLSATASWLTCEVMCIPAKDVTFSLPVDIASADAAVPTEMQAYSVLFDQYVARHPTPANQVTGVAFEGALSRSALKYNEAFEVAFKVSPTDGNTMALHTNQGEGSWPTFTPIVSNAEYYVDLTQMNATPDGGMLLVMAGETFEMESLPQDMHIGGLFQVKVNDEWVRTEFTIPMPWADAETETLPSDAPIWTTVTATKEMENLAAAIDKPAPTHTKVAQDVDDVRYSLDELGSPTMDDALCATMTEVKNTEGANTLIFMLFMAFLGGLLLNIMPCVLPVLTMKLYGLIEQVDISPPERRKAGLAYTAGIVVSFLALAAVVVALQNMFEQDVGWGFQFQYPMYTAALASIVFVFGLSLFGVFEIPAFGSNAAAGAGAKEGVAGYFFTGVFATLLATPCSAPFLGSAMGFAFGQSSSFVVIFFALAGLGLASPFIAIAYVPALFKLLPNPGAWMDTFKQFMGFTLVATTVWLVDVLAAQITVEATVGFIAFLAFLSGSAWIFGHWAGVAASAKRQVTTLLVAVAVSVLGGWYFLDFTPIESKMSDVTEGTIHWKMFREDRMASLLNRYRDGEDKYFAGQAVFMDFTAEWCLSCKANEKAFIETEAVKNVLEETGSVAIKADWTNYDENITKWLKCFQSAGVPYYAVLPADPSQKAILMGETVTTDSIVTAIKQASGK
jgi:thiol:disulfide interchange protein DsbD